MQKLLTYIFSKIISVYAIFDDQNFNNTLTNNIVSFEQLGPGENYLRIKLQAMHHAPPQRDIFPVHFCSIRAENTLS